MRMTLSPRILLFTLAVLAMSMAMSTASFAQVRISVEFGPPALPIYEQPLCPGDGYIWTPGYWAWDDEIDDYYWVPGTWVLAPEVGFLWTPPYWGWADGAFVFYNGYWGPQVGFYGGINYGFGYFGYGFAGGRWDHDRFFYNREVTNINVVNIHNVYEERVNNVTVNHVSYNGGPGGINVRPRPEEERAMHERHLPPVAVQTQHFQEARRNPELRASANHGRPPIAATPRPAEFRAAVPAREAGAPYNPPANRGGNRARGEGNVSHPGNSKELPPTERSTPNAGNSNRSRPVHPRDLPPVERATPNTGNSSRDRKYQQQQEKILARQDQERQKLQQRQEQEHQRMAQQNANEARKQQVEQRHQQQTQQMQERHTQQREQLQRKYQPPPAHGHK